MSTKAKLLFLCAFLLLVATFAVQLMTGLWLPINSVLLGAAGGVVVLAVLLDWKLYWEFFTMRTTKHGMNMGALILMVLVVLVCLNYLASKHNKTWDVTHERLNSLSEQSEKILNGLKQDVAINVFYKGPSALEQKNAAKSALQLFQDASSKLKVRFMNSYIKEAEALRALADQPDSANLPLIGFAELNGRKVRIDEAFDEAAITSALIKVTRESSSKIYFVRGHGERDIENDTDQGIKEFAKALNDAAFKTEPLSLIDKKEIPADAAALAIIGPSVPYLDAELEWVRQYMRQGGKLFLALDPGVHQNLANLTKPLGVEFENNYVITRAPVVGGGAATIIGRQFDTTSEITRSLPNGSVFAVFPLVSEVKPSPSKIAGIEARGIVFSDPDSFVITDVSKAVKDPGGQGAISLVVDARGTVTGADGVPDPVSKPFEMVVFGDSDFISNRGIAIGANRDLAMNTVAQLANQQDLLSIRPKLPKGSALLMTSVDKWLVLILGMALPVVLLITAGVMWFRRRGA